MNKALLSSNSEEWATPPAFFAALDAEFHFTLDPCATRKNAKCSRFYTIEDDGLTQNWGGQRVFCNPPYGRKIGAWVRKAYEESRKPGTLVVMLIPARTDTAYFHDYIYHKAKEVRFIRGRLHFNEAENAAPFPSMVVIFEQ
jgi:site-specific DNA-methyltransferase (adenine-specific)